MGNVGLTNLYLTHLSCNGVSMTQASIDSMKTNYQYVSNTDNKVMMQQTTGGLLDGANYETIKLNMRLFDKLDLTTPLNLLIGVSGKTSENEWLVGYATHQIVGLQGAQEGQQYNIKIEPHAVHVNSSGT